MLPAGRLPCRCSCRTRPCDGPLRPRAEEVGFEPTVPMRHNGFRDRPIRPLSHSSGRDATRSDLVRRLGRPPPEPCGTENEVASIPGCAASTSGQHVFWIVWGGRVGDDLPLMGCLFVRRRVSCLPPGPVLRRARPAGPLLRKEGRQERPALVGAHAGGHGQLVVEPGVRTEVVERAAGTGPRVARPVDQPADPGRDECTRAHRARLERHHHRDVGQSPAPDRGRGVAEGQHLGVRGRVASALTLVVTGRHDPPVDQRHGADGHLPLRGRCPCLGQGELHGVVVAQRVSVARGGHAPVWEVSRSPR